MVTSIAKHTIVVILKAVLMINMITWIAITSQPLVTAKDKLTIPNTVIDPDQNHDCHQGSVLVILEAQDTIMVTTFIMMTTGVEEGCARLLLPLV